MAFKRSRAAWLAVAAGALHAACLPGIGAWPLGFVSLAPLIAAVRGRGTREAAALGWLAGTVAATIAVVPWIASAAADYFDQPRWAALLFALLVSQVYGAIWFAAFGAAAARASALLRPPLRALAVASLWTSLEFLRAHALTGAPWALLGHALYAHPSLIQTAEFGGAYAVSFLLCLSAAALAEFIGGARRGALASIALAGLVLGGAWGYGKSRLTRPAEAGRTLRVALVQGNVPNAWRTDPGRFADAFEAFVAPTRTVLREHPDLVVWPENAVSFLLEPNPQFLREAAALLGPGGPPLVLGGPRYEAKGGRARFYNAAYLVSSHGRIEGHYDKRHLAPFAEYAPVPGIPWLGWRFDSPGDYTAGGVPTVFRRPDRFGVLICFEIIYPGLARDLARGGARFLLNLSNDAWFGTSAGLEQHFAASIFRAVETGRAVARATNTGITAVVSPRGEVLARYPAHRRAAWVAPVPLRDDLTFYTRHGDLFAAVLALASLLSLVRFRPGL